MKGMILAAGMGTRLQPLTNTIPKALIDVNGMTMLERVILKLKRADIDEITVNVHHHADQIERFLNEHDLGVTLHISDERDLLLGTGGAIKHARKYLDGDESFIIHNVDVISNIDLMDLVYLDQMSSALAVLAVRKRETVRQLCFSDTQHLVGWENTETGESKGSPGHHYAFSGIQLMRPELFNMMPDTAQFSIIDLYLSIAKTHPILAYDHSDGEWMDLGTAERLKKAITALNRENTKFTL